MFTMPRILVLALAVVLFAGAVVSIYDPHYHEPRKSYHRDPHIARQLQRHRPRSHRFNNQPRLSSAAYRYGADVEQQERHASRARPGWDYANNIDQHYEGCPAGFTGLQPYPYDCRRFVNCWKGRAYIQTCGPGTVFNDQTLECDNPSKVVCRGLSAKEVQTASSNRVGRLQSATAEISCPVGFTGLLPHPQECSKFLNCANGAVFVMNCGPQTMFSPKKNACDFAHKVDCGGRTGGSPPPPPPAGGNRGGKTIETDGWQSQPLNHQGAHRKGWPHNHDIHRVNHGHLHSSAPGHTRHHHHHGHHWPSTPTTSTTSTTTVPTPIFHRDRWTNMNRTRPSAYGNGTTLKTSPQLPPPRWTTTPKPTTATYYNHDSSGSRPTSTSSNYPHTDTTIIYNAEPVDEDVLSEEIFDQVFGGDIQEISLPYDRRNGSRGSRLPSVPHWGSPSPQDQSTDAIRIPNLNLMPPLDTQKPVSEEVTQFGGPGSSIRPRVNPDLASPPSGFGEPQSPRFNPIDNPAEDRQFQVPDQIPDFSLPQPSFSRHPSPPESDDQLKPKDDLPPFFSSQNPSFSDSNPPSFPPVDDVFVIPDESNLWGGMLPPPPPPSGTRPTGPHDPSPNPKMYPASEDEPSPWRDDFLPPDFPSPEPEQPNESEYTPLPSPSAATPFYQPSGVKTRVNVDQIRPPPAVQNAIPRVHASPLYSPSYSGISHSRDNKTPSLAPRSDFHPPTTTTSTQRPIEPEITFSRDEGVVLSAPHEPTTITQHRGALPPSYNHEFYKQTTPAPAQEDSFQGENSDEVGQLPISEAIRLLLRPYFNRSGTVTDEMASEAESHIMSLAKNKESTTTRRSTTTSTSTTTTSTTTTTTTTTVAPPEDKDVELVFAGEQEGMSRSRSRPDHSHAQPPSKYHYHQHNRDFHRSRPHLPNPFEKESREEEHNEPGGGINPLEADICEFDCGDGKCIKELEVCDGVAQCGNRRDEQKCEHLGYSIRLSNGDSGRVEVKIFGKWGYVCDDKFGIEDANVVCRELGFPLGASEVRGNSFYPPEEGRNVTFVMDELDCKGTETSLKECPFEGWGVSDCGPDEVVGIQCKTAAMKCPNNYWLCKGSSECIPINFLCDNVPDCTDGSDESSTVCNSTVRYRLKGGKSKQEGRLEVLYRSVWGTVCDDDFSQNEAQVACNSLGYYGKAKIVKNAFGPGTGPIWLDQVSCVGNESAIDSCAHWAWGEHNCNHTEDVSLKCSTGSLPASPKTDSKSTDEAQTQIFDDIGIDFDQLERSSKFRPNRRTCGHFNANLTEETPLEYERVVRGNIAKRGHHPWQATIRTKGQGGISSHWCGAVLISKKHLLTAAHCLVGYPKGAYFIRLGDHIANIAESSEIDSYIEDWYVHEKFREGTHMNNDIAVIVLKNPVRFNDYIQPICLPQEGSKYEEGRLCTISGWGSIQSGVSTPSNNLRAAQIPVMSDETCKLPHVYGNLITDGMFCAGFLDEGVDACEGDSGGPFVCSDSGTETLYGIISWGKQCGHSNKPGVYVRIEKYIDWIYGKIRLSMQTN